MRTIKLIPVLFPALFLCGCATSDEMKALDKKMDALTTQLSSVQANQADLSNKMDDLSGNITASNENIKDLDSQLQRLSSRIDDISTVMANKAAADAAAAQQKVILPSKLFEDARDNIDKGNLGLAEDGLHLYLQNYPSGEYAENSQYLLGDIYYAQKKYQEAAVAYATVLQNYPKSKSTASYRLKYANSIIPLKKYSEAKKYLKSIVQDFPKSPEARAAAATLAKMK